MQRPIARLISPFILAILIPSIAYCQTLTGVQISDNSAPSYASFGSNSQNAEMWAELSFTVLAHPPYWEGPPPGQMITPPPTYNYPDFSFLITGTITEVTHSPIAPSIPSMTINFNINCGGYEVLTYNDLEGPDTLYGDSESDDQDALLDFTSSFTKTLPANPESFLSQDPSLDAYDVSCNGTVGGWTSVDDNGVYTWTGQFYSNNQPFLHIDGGSITSWPPYLNNTALTDASMTFTWVGEYIP